VVVEGVEDVIGDSFREPDDAEDMAAGVGEKEETGEVMMRESWPSETKRDVEIYRAHSKRKGGGTADVTLAQMEMELQEFHAVRPIRVADSGRAQRAAPPNGNTETPRRREPVNSNDTSRY
jgi:hypothetical protein